MLLQYPKSFMPHVKIKTLKIHKHKCSPEVQNNNFSKNNTLNKYIIVPNNLTTNIIKKKKTKQAWN